MSEKASKHVLRAAAELGFNTNLQFCVPRKGSKWQSQTSWLNGVPCMFDFSMHKAIPG